MERMARVLRRVLKHLKDSRGVSLYEITAAVAMTGILAATAVPVILDQVQLAKIAKTQLESDTIQKAIGAFQKDTGKIPGEAEGTKLLVSGVAGGAATSPLPVGAGEMLTIPGSTSAFSAAVGGVVTCTSCRNMNDFLVRNPNIGSSAGFYQNWKGPYMEEITQDPWDRAYVVNVQALYVAEPAGSQINTCGYAWILSGGPNRALETSLLATNFSTTSDDIGKNSGKKNPPGPSCVSQ